FFRGIVPARSARRQGWRGARPPGARGRGTRRDPRAPPGGAPRDGGGGGPPWRGPRRRPWFPAISAFTRVFDALCAGMSGGGASTQTAFVQSLARARLRGVQVCFCPFSVIVVQQLAAISLLDGPRPRRMNWPFRDSVCAVKRRAGACRLMQVTVRIRLPTARDARDWRVHRRSSPTAEVWNSAG